MKAAPNVHGVGQIVHGWPPEAVGGSELYAHALFEGFRANGIASAAFARRASGTEEYAVEDQDGVRTLRLTADGVKHFEQTWFRADIAPHFREWLAIHKPRVVHFHHLTWLSTDLPRRARDAGALVVYTLHDYWLFCPRGQLVDAQNNRCTGPQAAKCAQCLDAQTALNPVTASLGRGTKALPESVRNTLRAWVPRPNADHQTALLKKRRQAIDRAIEAIHRFTTPSEHMRQRAIEFGIPADRIETLDLPLVQPIVPAPAPGDGPVRFLFIGTLLPTKGVDRLVNAFAKLPAGGASLALYGPRVSLDNHPDFAQRLAQRVDEIPNATLHPAFAPGDASAVLAEADVLVIPSTWEENSPLVLREAQAAGLRVIASEIGGIPELSETARWVPPDDDEALLVALQTESRVGRRRVSPRAYASPDEHAALLLDRYRTWAREAQLEPIDDSR